MKVWQKMKSSFINDKWTWTLRLFNSLFVCFNKFAATEKKFKCCLLPKRDKTCSGLTVLKIDLLQCILHFYSSMIAQVSFRNDIALFPADKLDLVVALVQTWFLYQSKLSNLKHPNHLKSHLKCKVLKMTHFALSSHINDMAFLQVLLFATPNSTQHKVG